MKFLILAIFLTLPAFAQMPKMPSSADLTNLSKEVMASCNEDKSKVSGCESYTEVTKLKACLMKNESQLSEKCKKSLKLVK
jgi:hypothetical protein